MIDLLTKAASLEPIVEKEIQKVSRQRRRIVQEISRLSRDSNFRKKVVVAYERRCAVTRIQLRLIDAAHILPVGAEGSNDEVTNGICLSPTYHRAFDHSLIYLDESLKMQINHAKEEELIKHGLAGGLREFKSFLGQRIHLPADRSQWPDIALVRAANKFRRIKS